MTDLQDATKSQIPASRHEEYQYLDLVREILENGEHRPDRYVLFPNVRQTRKVLTYVATGPAQAPTPSSHLDP
jgi:hypothetical protein